ncbi:MAG: leucine-rich repeat domain-containing protein, partial [Muribaculaceae bacterium]|nr:leucine-rich repeat domain-containing protein [Muribaculaceae bacterium]
MDRTTLMTRLAAVALLLLLPTVAMGYSFKVDGIYYNTIGNGNVEVTYLSTLMPGTYCGDITIPDSVTFRDKTYHVTAIGDEAFTNCIYLKNITLPNCIERIGDYAFRECTKLDNITIPTMVKSIGKYAFNNCKFLDVTCLSVSPPAIDGSATFTCCPTATLHVPPQSVIAYRSALYWQDFAEIARDATGYIVDYLYDFVVDGIYYNVEDGQATVTNNGHTGCYSGDVVIPEEVTYGGMTYPVVAIGDSAFKN